jgi:hypothetical protein
MDHCLALYSFGLFTRRIANDKITPVIAIFSPVACFFLSKYSVGIFNGYKFGFELLASEWPADLYRTFCFQQKETEFHLSFNVLCCQRF